MIEEAEQTGLDKGAWLKHATVVPLHTLKAHPRNYRTHPDDEIEHIMESIRVHGVYRNVVISGDGKTILAGHGVVEAARRLGLTHVPIFQTEYLPDDPRALKLLVGDNEIQHLVENDDRALTELLRELKEVDELLGTGYDEMMLANLVMVSRPASEIEDLDAAAQWAGMPEYDLQGDERLQIIVNFASEEDRQEFCKVLGLEVSKIHTKGHDKSIWWPVRGDHDTKSIRFTSGNGQEDS
jgi:ParB-like nuclease domain